MVIASADSPMREIGSVARELGLSCEVIRRWEAQGKIAPVLRTANGVRLYRPEDVARLRAQRATPRRGGTRRS